MVILLSVASVKGLFHQKCMDIPTAAFCPTVLHNYGFVRFVLSVILARVRNQ